MLPTHIQGTSENPHIDQDNITINTKILITEHVIKAQCRPRSVLLARIFFLQEVWLYQNSDRQMKMWHLEIVSSWILWVTHGLFNKGCTPLFFFRPASGRLYFLNKIMHQMSIIEIKVYYIIASLTSDSIVWKLSFLSVLWSFIIISF